MSAVAFHAGQVLKEVWPDRASLECPGCGFDLAGYLEADLATVEPIAEFGHSEVITGWGGCSDLGKDQHRVGAEGEAVRHPMNAWFRVRWNGLGFDVLSLTWKELVRTQRVWFLVGEHLDEVQRFHRTVCEWTSQPHAEVLVFERSAWRKDRALFESIRSTRPEELERTDKRPVP